MINTNKGNKTEHNALKEYARKLLEQMGFKKGEIFEEYTIKTPDMKEGFRVDVAGIKLDKKIAIECGITNSDKLVWLKLFFDEIIILPFFKMDTESVLLERRIRELEEKLRQTENESEETERRYKNFVDNSNELQAIYLLVKTLFGCLEGKSNYKLGLWDYNLTSATDMLFQGLEYWKKRYEELREKNTSQSQKL